MEAEEKDVNLRLELGLYHRLGHSPEGSTQTWLYQSRGKNERRTSLEHLRRIEGTNATVPY